MAYLQDILGLLSLRNGFGLGQDQLRQRAHEFELEYGLSKDEAQRAASQWQQRFQEEQARRRFEQQQQQATFAQQVGQQNYLNQSRDFGVGQQIGRDRTSDLLQLLRESRGTFGPDQTNALLQRLGLPTVSTRSVYGV